MNQTFKILAGWLLAFVIVMYFARSFQSTKQTNDMDYSKFVNDVQTANVQAVTIRPEDRLIVGEMKDKTEFKVVMPDDPNQVLKIGRASCRERV